MEDVDKKMLIEALINNEGNKIYAKLKKQKKLEELLNGKMIIYNHNKIEYICKTDTNQKFDFEYFVIKQNK